MVSIEALALTSAMVIFTSPILAHC